ncbi:flavin-containing monooxygenase [Bythopirellula polymerisocia]|uniref:4-hydroxybenzoate brominase (decarboxylating) n=1 Tax=Bythopirellula polymerisocia TaxID=2528003 RepID=A0A5C6D020_9BACT|nr:NAD(P)-binding domain-containing protein [Bythopirellula polymerisocia]TWU29535.1 4-hydroxyacetophenone monooxygenase [Bythopirellula polymerisocia]
MHSSYADRYCILGAGTSGLAVAKNFLQQGIPFDCLEREDSIGGNWCYGKPASSVYASTHLISSKRLTEYTDFPMPEEYPEFPGHELVHAYLQDYARHFDLLPHIRFNTTVERIEPSASKWRITLAGGETRNYRGVVIANGHNWDPSFPEKPGEFSGTTLHSCEYKTPDVLSGKRVLVVGGGNSGCDLAVESATYADRAFHSMRRGYPILPKFFKGKPIDQCGETLLRWRIPLPLRRLAAKLVVRWVLGPPEMVGLPRPDHKLFETHPVINSRLHDQIAHGNLHVKPDIAELAGDTVRFVDGSSEQIDLIIYATGFKLSFPFIEKAELNWRDGRPDFFLNIFHPERNDLFCAGLIQPDSGQWGLVDYQSQLMASYLVALRNNSPAAARFNELKQSSINNWNGRGSYLDSPRHRLEVEHFGYRRELKKLIGKLV